MNAADVRAVGVVGAGQMGSGIAQVAAAAGLRVLLADASVPLAQRGKDKIAAALAKQVEKGKLDAASRDALLARIEPSELSAFGEVDVAIEAATENPELKAKLFRDMDAALRPGALLVSNTSSISITRLAAATARPELVAGMHFMNPVPLMKLVEVIRAVQTSDETFTVVRELAVRLGKTVTCSTDRPGFVVNRMLVPFLNEACVVLQEGIGSPDDIDVGAKLGLNHPMGPLELADLIGLDTLLSIAEVLHRDLGEDRYRPAVLLRNLVAAGWLGKKAGRGFYVYDEKGQKLGPSKLR